MDQHYLKLSSGFSMPVIGVGTAYKFRKSNDTDDAFQKAIETGYRHFDCAHLYCNEEDIGAALQKHLSNGNVKREDFFITTKLWMTEMSPELVKPACVSSLKRLGLDYLDLYLIHWPTAIQRTRDGTVFPDTDSDGFARALDVDYVDTWKEMQKLVKDGLVRSIGVSNFSKRQLERVLACAEIPPAVNQIECHPYLQQTKLIEFCKEKNIVVTAYAPLGCQLMANATKKKLVFDEPVIKEIAEKHRKTTAQVVLRFHVQRGITIIPFSKTPKNIESNFRVFDFELDDEDMKKMMTLDEGMRIFGLKGEFKELFGVYSNFINHPHFPFHDAY